MEAALNRDKLPRPAFRVYEPWRSAEVQIVRNLWTRLFCYSPYALAARAASDAVGA